MSEESSTNPVTSAAAFFFAHDLFRNPGPEQWAFLQDPVTERIWTALASPFGFAESMGLPENPENYESEFIEAFEVGSPHPPVPLIESHYNKRDPAPRILHENVLFYSAFGLRLRSAGHETADHLRHQLEFVGYLYKLESTAFDHQIRHARHDFLERRLLSWLPAAAERAAKAPSAWIRNYTAFALRIVREAEKESAG